MQKDPTVAISDGRNGWTDIPCGSGAIGQLPEPNAAPLIPLDIDGLTAPAFGGGSLAAPTNDARSRSSVTLVLRIMGTTVYPFAVDGNVLTVFDARYTAIHTENALASLARHVLYLQRHVSAARVFVIVSPRHRRQQTKAVENAIESILRRAGVVVETNARASLLVVNGLQIMDRRVAWELVKILRGTN
jgi:hypothetical protein